MDPKAIATMSSSPRTSLCCLVEGDDMPFVVKVADINITELKVEIHGERARGLFGDFDAADLALYKTDVILRDLAKHDRKDIRVGEQDEELTGWDGQHVSSYWPSQPALGRVHIMVALPEVYVTDTRPFKRRHLSESFPLPPPNSSPRSNVVSALYQRLKKYGFVQVRGTPSSGKTTLAKLLAEHIDKEVPKKHVIWVGNWPYEDVEELGGHRSYLEQRMSWVQGKPTVFIFDNAQSSYVDKALWGEFFKSMHEYPERRAIAFTSYSCPAWRSGPPSTLFDWNDMQKVTLRAVDHEDGIPPVGLFFSRSEFNDLVSRFYPRPEYYFDESFLENVFTMTDGHVGAIRSFLDVVAKHDSYRVLRTADAHYTWDRFLKHYGPRDFSSDLYRWANILRRSQPLRDDLIEESVARVFSTVLRNGIVTKSSFTGKKDKDALQFCFEHGWLHTDKLVDSDRRDSVGYFFASSLHRWHMEWRLWDTLPGISFDADDILKFVVNVVGLFSPRILSAKRRIGPGFVQRPRGAQYQDEFYRCCHTLSNGSLLTLPEFGMAKGRVDFYIPAKQWGVEVLRDGNQLANHSGHFSQPGSYGSTLPIVDYIVLDFRATHPKVQHPNLQKLYHIVFSDNFRNVAIINNVLHGKFALLTHD